MEFLARHYEDILLDYRFIRAIGVQLIDSRLNQIQGAHLKFITRLPLY